MKNFTLILVLFSTIFAQSLFAQAPHAFKYQAVARDKDGALITDKFVSLKISMLEGSEEGQVVYSELHRTSTGKLGLINLEIGRGNVTDGTFSNINWGDYNYYIKVEIDIEGGYDFALIHF